MVAPGDEALPPSEGGEGNVADLVGDLFSAASTMVSYKPKGMLLGHRRDTQEPVDIAPQVLARHGAMLGSTGSGKTVMAKPSSKKRRWQVSLPSSSTPRGTSLVWRWALTSTNSRARTGT